MQKRLVNYLFFSFMAVLLIASAVSAVWWNPNTWGITGSAVASNALIPTMTSNTAPSGVASASLESSGLNAWKAMDGDLGGYPSIWSASGTAGPYWISYQFPSSVNVDSFSIAPWSDAKHNPSYARLEYLSGGQWLTAYTIGPNYNGNFGTFTLASPVTSNAFRLYVIRTSGAVAVNIKTWQLYGNSVASPTCTSFTYSAWGACSSTGQQTRTLVSSSPSGCTGGSPEALIRGCTYTSTCSYTYSAWSTCSNGIQTKTVNSITPSGCSGVPESLTRNCISTPSNDNFNNALLVNNYAQSTGAIPVNINGAGSESGESSVSGNTVWYKYISSINGKLYINYSSSTSGALNLVPALNVYSGSSIGSLTMLRSIPLLMNDQIVEIPILQNRVYHLQFGRSAGNVGSGIGSFKYVQVVSSSFCSDTDINSTYSDGLNYYLSGTAVGASGISSSDYCGTGYYSNTVYESYCRTSDNSVSTAYYNCPTGTACQNGACLVVGGVANVGAVPCTSFNEGSYGACSNGYRYRSVAGIPAGCSGGAVAPSMSEPCSDEIDLCDDADWSYVIVPIGSGLKERRWSKAGNCVEGVSHSTETLSVNALDAPLTCFSFSYGAWTPSNCVVGSQQTRNALGSSGGVQNAQCIGGNPVLTQSCPENTQTVATGACSFGDAPVCSSDEVTYSNSCNAVAAGASVACEGECPCPATENPAPAGIAPAVVPTVTTPPTANPTTTLPTNSCSGCTLDDKCVSFGHRTASQYCTISRSFADYKGEGLSCDNNFECSSNLCISGKCTEADIFQKIIDYFRSFFS